MAVRTPIEETEGLYFITFTCCQWLPLFKITNGYDTVYKWFDYLKSKNHFVKGYVMRTIGMPNHLHVFIDFSTSKARRKKQQVFERSFDFKLITNHHFFLEKLNSSSAVSTS